MRKIIDYKKPLAFGFIFLCCSLFLSAGQTPPQVKENLVPVKKSRSGLFEIEVHYGTWSLNLIKATFEDELTNRLGKEIRKQIEKEVNSIQPGIIRAGYEENLAFESDGQNYGLELRFYPKGRDGPFSLGLSFEKTHMKMSLLGSVIQNFGDGTHAVVEAQGFIEISPFTTNLSFRWDINPRWLVTPYFVCGIGLAPLDGTIGYGFTGVYNWAGPDESISDSEEKNFKEAEEEIEFNLPNIFIIAQLHFGIRAELLSHLVLRVEGGFWDGIVLRGGLGYRF